MDLDDCIKCTTCLSQCPVGAVNILFDGPKRLGPDLARIGRTGRVDYPASLKMCSNCKNCDLACPHGVHISRLINQARGAAQEKVSLRDSFLAEPERAGRLMVNPVVRVLAGRLSGDGLVARAGRRLLGLSPNVAFLRDRGGSRVPGGRSGSKRVVYFPGCFARFFEPRVGAAAVRILNHLGYRVEVPETHCCGLPLVANGSLSAARDRAKRNLAILAPLVEEGLDVVTTCPSCALMLRREYGEFFGLEGAGALAARVRDLFELVGTDSLPAARGRFAYHAPCHLRALGTGSAALAYFSSMPGAEVEDLDGGCCGQAGSYGFKTENYATAVAVGQKLFSRVREAQPATVLTECGTCRMQIKSATGLAVEHPASVLADILAAGDGAP